MPRQKASVWRSKFIEALRDTANVSTAASVAGVSRMTAYKHRDRSEQFAKQWQDALEEACDALEREAWRRAVEGYEHPVIHQGEITDTYRRYSDTLLIVLLKAHRPEKYREHNEITLSGGEKPLTVKILSGVSMDDI